MQMPKRKRYQKDATTSDDIVTLIQLVRQNPALYNYKLQPNQRRRSDILYGWSQVAMQIGNKYTVEECRRKWKNLRDTYHQYRLRKSKVGNGLSKWRYAKELDFLSTIYQPKLKASRLKYEQNFSLLQEMQTDGDIQNNEDDGGGEQQRQRRQRNNGGDHDDDDDDINDDDDDSIVHQQQHSHRSSHHHHHHHSNITLVSDDAETFILHAYEESVNDGVVSIDHSVIVPDDSAAAVGTISSRIGDHVVEDVVEIVKNEHVNSSSMDEDEDDGAGAEVDYEEVCLYEEACQAPSVDSETIIGGSGGTAVTTCVGAVNSSHDSKTAYEYFNSTEFCIEPVTMSASNAVAAISSSNNVTKSFFKTISVLAPTTAAAIATPTTAATTSSANIGTSFLNNGGGGTTSTGTLIQSSSEQQQSATNKRDELDLFFEFLKNKMQRLSQVDITSIQIEFLNCVLQREAAGGGASKIGTI